MILYKNEVLLTKYLTCIKDPFPLDMVKRPLLPNHGKKDPFTPSHGKKEGSGKARSGNERRNRGERTFSFLNLASY